MEQGSNQLAMGHRPAPASSSLPMGWLTLGLLFGVAYGVLDTALDLSLFEGHTLGFNAFHRFFNTITPPVAGMVVGLLFAYMRQRDALVTAERKVSEALRERLKGAERQQAVWLLASSLLHDIRNPLHALGLLLDEATGLRPDPSALPEVLNRARAQAERIEQRLGSLREMAECPPRQRQHIDVAILVRDIVADLSDVAARRGVKLLSGPVPEYLVDADERYLRTPLENLIMNGIDAAESAPMPRRVVVGCLSGDAETVITVSDTGAGVSQEARTSLFTPLHSGKSHGMGLGLPLARALARLEGGEVKLLRSDPGETVFGFVLPDRKNPCRHGLEQARPRCFPYHFRKNVHATSVFPSEDS